MGFTIGLLCFVQAETDSIYTALLVDARARRLMNQYGLQITDVFTGPERLRQELAAA